MLKIVVNELGIVVMMLGVGCKIKEDDIDYVVGLKLYKKIGDIVIKGELLLIIYSNDEEIFLVIELLYKNIEIGELVMKLILIYDIIIE